MPTGTGSHVGTGTHGAWSPTRTVSGTRSGPEIGDASTHPHAPKDGHRGSGAGGAAAVRADVPAGAAQGQAVRARARARRPISEKERSSSHPFCTRDSTHRTRLPTTRLNSRARRFYPPDVRRCIAEVLEADVGAKAWRGEDEGILTVALCEAVTARVKGEGPAARGRAGPRARRPRGDCARPLPGRDPPCRAAAPPKRRECRPRLRPLQALRAGLPRREPGPGPPRGLQVPVVRRARAAAAAGGGRRGLAAVLACARCPPPLPVRAPPPPARAEPLSRALAARAAAAPTRRVDAGTRRPTTGRRTRTRRTRCG